MSLDKELDVPEIKRLIYLLNNKIKSTKYVLSTKNKELSGDDQARMVSQIEYDERLIKIFQKEIDG